ncbi:PTS sugar transporter subunit IIB [Garciella nitratireducens]|uniref:PTS system, cellobiose-specific IIB component n=1 Tax=Garciella nitratireducens DSM 15102 TaxID=1121911 RepID=A0A1T4M5J3_9FIRM|nr:PTS sugar transporter subunit IIB [Garciella nitratireducens]RBP44020.1 PTS system cellobiose-specific IIB component [Garciella nitratireducens]SJZ62192.1 PTS system, cellobiose-specific IIB component [Garciella nitratireducens DSM 15102]
MSEKPIKLIILCSWGATSSQLAKKVQQAAQERGVNLEAHAGGTGEFSTKASEFDVALLEPQVRHMKKEVTKIAEKHNIPVDLVDQRAFALMDGNKVLDQVLKMLNK